MTSTPARLRKAVLPVAGLGTRVLPGTKTTPKELLNVVDRPILSYIVEEAREAGIEHIVFVTGRSKEAIEDYFDHQIELEAQLEAKGKTVKVITVGRKGATYLRRDFGSRFVEEVSYAQVKRLGFEQADAVAAKVTAMLEAGEFDVCSLIYNRFHSVISQIPSEQQLIPATVPAPSGGEAAAASSDGALYEFEPGEEELLEQLLPKNLSIQVYRALLESAAGFYGAQMNAMDNATRNAGDMINKLTLSYNRTRQANITTELIEIISGASAV